LKNLEEVREMRVADRLEVICLVDNVVDDLSSEPRQWVEHPRDWVRTKAFHRPHAEHGFSLLIRASKGSESHSVIFDAGSTETGVVENAKLLGVDLREVESLVLSHGHRDHWGGLLAVLRTIGRDKMPLILHPDVFLKRGRLRRGRVESYSLFPRMKSLRGAGAKTILKSTPHVLAGGMIWTTGEIPHRTDFERGHPSHRVFVKGKWRRDPWLRDDNALLANVKGKGLVVFSGCAHAGIVNTVLHAQTITGVKRVYGIMGGFHLAGRDFEPLISPTVKAIEQIKPGAVVPCHCTGWRGIHAFAAAMPQAFIQNSVGNRYTID